MKLGVLIVAFLLSFFSALAQEELTLTNVPSEDVKLYRITIKTLSNETIDGVLWAVTDSTLLYFNNERMAIRKYQSGILPQIDTVQVTAIKRIGVRRRGHFARSAVIGGTIATGLFLFVQSSQTSTFEGYISKLIVSGFIVPALVLSSIVGGLIPPVQERIRGSGIRFMQFAPQLRRYSILSQIRSLPSRTAMDY